MTKNPNQRIFEEIYNADVCGWNIFYEEPYWIATNKRRKEKFVSQQDAAKFAATHKKD